MRQLLYITPYFPPQTQVGALRPLKFVRHLPALGWQPIVLCDLWASDAADTELEGLVPQDVIVARNYSRRAHAAYAELHSGVKKAKAVPRGKPLHERIIPQSLQNPEWMPLGEHSPDMPWAYRAARRLLKLYPNIEAIVVNADPFAASVVGARLHQTTGLPVIQDFRDIWAPCKLRRPRRPKPWLWLEDKLERYCFENAAHVVVNTQISLNDYRRFYPEMPPEKFSVIRNFFDAELVDHGQHVGFDRYTLLHLGHFSRFRVADPLVRALAQALALGVPRDQIQVVSTGAFGSQARELAKQLGIDDLLHQQVSVPYQAIGALMHSADLLVMIAEPDADQRIASKFYDYLGAGRPLLAISDNPESKDILDTCGAGAQFAHADIAAMAHFIAAEFAAGRQRNVERNLAGLDAVEASRNLVKILDAVTGKPTRGAGEI